MNKRKDERAALDAVLSHLEINISGDKKALLLKHLELLLEENKRTNLTRIISKEEGITLHIADSLSVLREFNLRDGLFLDLGTGGGFPGLPLGIVSERQGILLDSTIKKANAVNRFIEELGLSNQLKSIGMRSEELAKEYGERFSVVIARAVSSLEVLEEYSVPLLEMNGLLVAMRGNDSKEEIERANKVAEILGMELIETRTFNLENVFSRSVYVYKKVSQPSIELPRRPGMALKKPLFDKYC